MMNKMIATVAASAIAVTPIAASAAPGKAATSLSVAKSARAATATGASEKAGGAGSIGVYLVGAALAVGFGFLVVKNADREDSDSN